MNNPNPSMVDDLNKVLSSFLEYCAIPIDWKAYAIVDSSGSDRDEPVLNGISVVVSGDGFRLYDPLEDLWTDFDSKKLFFTIRDGNRISVVVPGDQPESMVERPLMRFEELTEIAACIAMHVPGAITSEGQNPVKNPIEEVLLPLAQYPDDEASNFHQYPYVPVRFLRSLLRRHCEEKCPWLVAIDWNEYEKVELFVREKTWELHFTESEQESAEAALTSLHEIRALHRTIREEARTIAAGLDDSAFHRSIDPAGCFELKALLFSVDAEDDEIHFPFLIKFREPIFLPFCAQDICPNFTQYMFYFILREAHLPDENWPPEISREVVEKTLDLGVEVPTYAEQVAAWFEIRTLQFRIECQVPDLLGGNVGEGFRSARKRIKSLRTVANTVGQITNTIPSETNGKEQES